MRNRFDMQLQLLLSLIHIWGLSKGCLAAAARKRSFPVIFKSPFVRVRNSFKLILKKIQAVYKTLENIEIV